jgi:sigma-E factor negative regulatory protein RseC
VLEEIAEVVEVHSDFLLVSSSRLSACNTCQASANCGQRSLAGLFGNKTIFIKLENPERLTVEVGQSVVLGLHEHALLKSSVVMYLIPLLFLIISAVAATLFNLSEGLIIVSGLVALLLGFVVARKLSTKLLSNPNYTPRLLRIAQ